MSYPLMARAWEIVGIDSKAKLALLALADCCNQERDTQGCWPSLPWLAERTGLPRRSLIRALAEQAQGLLERTTSKGRSTHYRLVLAPATEPDREASPRKPQGSARSLEETSATLALVPTETSATLALLTPETRATLALPTEGSSATLALPKGQSSATLAPSSATLAPRTSKEPEEKTRGKRESARATQPRSQRSPALSDPLALDWRTLAGIHRPDLSDPEQVWAKFRAFYGIEGLSSPDWARRWGLWLARERENYPGCRIFGAMGARTPGSFLATPVTAIDATCEVLHES